MKNQYFDELLASGKSMTRVQSIIARELKRCDDKLVIYDRNMTIKENLEMVQQLSLAGINDVYINNEWSNQMETWMAIDSFGMKLRGIEMVDNPKYAEDMNLFRWSSEVEQIPAFHFSLFQF